MTREARRAHYYDPRVFQYTFSDAELEFNRAAFPREGSLYLIRQVITHCWLKLPAREQTIESLAVEVQRLVTEALREFEEDRDRVRAQGQGSSEIVGDSQ
jgi:hypothetical protein